MKTYYCKKCGCQMEITDVDERQEWSYLDLVCVGCNRTLTIKEDKESERVQKGELMLMIVQELQTIIYKLIEGIDLTKKEEREIKRIIKWWKKLMETQ